jgi:hypothetical protein
MGCSSSSNKKLLDTIMEDMTLKIDKIKILVEDFQNYNSKDQKSILKIIQSFFDTVEVMIPDDKPNPQPAEQSAENQNKPADSPNKPSDSQNKPANNQ